MKCPFPRPPEGGELRGLRVHEAVRDHPEVLAVLRRLQVDPLRNGAMGLADVLDDDGLRQVNEAVAWRRERQRDGPEKPGS